MPPITAFLVEEVAGSCETAFSYWIFRLIWGLQVTEVKWMALHPFALLSVPTGLALLDAHGCVRRSGSWGPWCSWQAQPPPVCMGKRWQLLLQCSASPLPGSHSAALPPIPNTILLQLLLQPVVFSVWMAATWVWLRVGFPSLCLTVGEHEEIHVLGGQFGRKGTLLGNAHWHPQAEP